jgi:hypothetical protein
MGANSPPASLPDPSTGLPTAKAGLSADGVVAEWGKAAAAPLRSEETAAAPRLGYPGRASSRAAGARLRCGMEGGASVPRGIPPRPRIRQYPSELPDSHPQESGTR